MSSHRLKGMQDAASEGIKHRMEPDFVVWRKEPVQLFLSISWEEVTVTAQHPTGSAPTASQKKRKMSVVLPVRPSGVVA